MEKSGKSGAKLAFGTDYQVEPLNPMEGLYAAVTRKERLGEEGEGWFPEEKIYNGRCYKILYPWCCICPVHGRKKRNDQKQDIWLILL